MTATKESGDRGYSLSLPSPSVPGCPANHEVAIIPASESICVHLVTEFNLGERQRLGVEQKAYRV